MTLTLLTGLPRSGTTLLCALLSGLPDTVALAEPMPRQKADDPVEVIANVMAFAAGVRERALGLGVVPSKAIAGRVIDNFMEAPKEGSGLRRVLSRTQDVAVGKPLTEGFRLYIKHPALFTALAQYLPASMQLYAMVRSPLAVLASWQTIDFPVHYGHIPAAEKLDPELHRTLAAIPDRIDRQVAVMGWFLRQFARLPQGRVIRYEDLTANPAATLSALQPVSGRVKHDIYRQRAEDRYSMVDMAELARRLERIAPLAERFYPRFRHTLKETREGAPSVLRNPGLDGKGQKRRIDFFIGGVQKGGTTALASLLGQHPAVRLANRKEVHFFDDETQDWTRPDYEAFHCWFRPVAPAAAVWGEATPIYLFLPEALRRIRRYNPAARFIVCLRHPTFRAHSHWRMETARGHETLGFSAAISPEGRARLLLGPREARMFSYVERGRYDQQLRRLFALFPRENVHILRTDRLWCDSGAALSGICAFLGIDPPPGPLGGSAPAEYTVPVDSRHVGGITPADRRRLDRVFRGSIEQTQALTGLDLSDWLDPDYREPMPPPFA